MPYRMIPTAPSASGRLGSQDNSSGQQIYAAAAGAFVDVPDLAADGLTSQRFGRTCLVGTTAQRPPSVYLPVGTLFIDTTVPAVIYWDTANWRNLLTGATA